MKISIDSSGVHLNSKTYVGECTNMDILDIGKIKYDGKVLLYPSGKYQIVKASKSVFRVPVPNVLPNKKIYRDYYPCSDEEETENEKREDNIQRAKNRMRQIILSNEWDYFLTVTFDDEKVNAKNVPEVMKKLQRWLKNLTYRKNIGYLLVPEYHKKEKRVHCHALISGQLDLSFNNIYKVKGIKKPIKEETIKKYNVPVDRVLYPVYNCKDWKYGFSTAISVYGTPSRLANYVLKYITKDIENIFGKTYWCSKNLKLYPDIELFTLAPYEFRETPGREYWHRGAEASFKYINRLGDALEEMSDDEETI